MKRSILNFIASILVLSSCQSENGFKMVGKIEGVNEGTVYLITMNQNKQDTLAKSDLKAGEFTLSGKTDKEDIAYLAVKGVRGALPIFIENCAFDLHLNLRNPIANTIKGGKMQEIANQYNALHREWQAKAMPIRKAFAELQNTGTQAQKDSLMQLFNQSVVELTGKENNLIKANPDSPVSAYIIANNKQMPIEKVKERFAWLSEKGKNTTIGKQIAEQIAKLEKVAVGQIAPNFTLTTPEGTPISLYDIKGKVKLIDFWASWCGPCRAENPNVVKIYKEFHPKGLEIFGVSLDRNKADWEKAIKDDQLTWKHGSDLKYWQSEVVQLYAIKGIPHTVLVDENNRIVAKDLRGDALRAKIAELLK